MVGPERLELSHIAALDPKSSASTNFATGPWHLFIFSCQIFFRAVSQLVERLPSPLTKRYLIVLFGRVPQAQSATAQSLTRIYKFIPSKVLSQVHCSFDFVMIFCYIAVITNRKKK